VAQLEATKTRLQAELKRQNALIAVLTLINQFEMRLLHATGFVPFEWINAAQRFADEMHREADPEADNEPDPDAFTRLVRETRRVAGTDPLTETTLRTIARSRRRGAGRKTPAVKTAPTRTGRTRT
jgi:hypothetical protein